MIENLKDQENMTEIKKEDVAESLHLSKEASWSEIHQKVREIQEKEEGPKKTKSPTADNWN